MNGETTHNTDDTARASAHDRYRQASLPFDPPPLSVLQLRLTYRVEVATDFPRWKGAMLRGGLGRALRRTLCPTPDPVNTPCRCEGACPYSVLFASSWDEGQPIGSKQSPEQSKRSDAPRAYTVRPPLDHKSHYAAGDTLSFGLVLIGRAIEYAPHVIAAYERLGDNATDLGLGASKAPCRLVAVESVDPLTGISLPLLQRGYLLNQQLVTTGEQAFQAAKQLPTTLKIHFPTPMRIKRSYKHKDVPVQHGDIVATPKCSVLVESVLYRMQHLSSLFGDEVWQPPVGELLQMAEQVPMPQCHVSWVDWSRLSGATGQKMVLGGFVGSCVYEDVPPEIRATLLAGSLVQTGKATVFGHGQFYLKA